MNADDVKYKIEVMQAYAEGKEIEWSLKEVEDWNECPTPLFDWSRCVYRVKPEIIEKPSINWDHVSDEFNYLTVDRQGDIKSAWLYENKPHYSNRGFGWVENTGGIVELAFVFEDVYPGNCDPQDSLVCRPGFE